MHPIVAERDDNEYKIFYSQKSASDVIFWPKKLQRSVILCPIFASVHGPVQCTV